MADHLILPADLAAHGISGLPVTELLEELEHRNEGQAPRRKARLSSGGTESAEVLSWQRTLNSSRSRLNSALGYRSPIYYEEELQTEPQPARP